MPFIYEVIIMFSRKG